MDGLVNAATPFVEKLVNQAIVECRYLCCYNNIVGDFENGKKDLIAKRKTIADDIEEARDRTDLIVNDVTYWMEKANSLIEEDIKTKKNCLFPWCPNCFWQYRRGKQLAGKTQDIKELIENSKFEKLACAAKPPGVEFNSSEGFINFESRSKSYQEVLDALENGNDFMIGLYGMGGSGKTELVRHVGTKVQDPRRFNKVIFVVVSNPPFIKRIQDDIAGPLGLKLDKESRESERAKKLCWLRLTNGEKILIILDDVWEELRFEDIGIPFHQNRKGLCVLLTTRDRKVCNLMRCQRTIQLEILSEEDSWKFFQNRACITDASSGSLKDVAKEISKKCKGLPVAIAAIASTLKAQDLEDWKAALRALETTMPVDDDDELVKIYKCLRLSYNYLKSEKAKKLFLLCSLFPEDYEIPIEDLTRFGIGLGLFGEVHSYEAARDQVGAAKKKLIDSCLLLKAEGGQCTKMHDLVRGMALWIAENKIQLITGANQNPRAAVLDEIRVKYLYYCDMDELPNQLEHCTGLEILLVDISRFCSDDVALKVSHVFFKGKNDLRVLAMMNKCHWERKILLLPRSIQLLTNLRTLRLRHWKLVGISILGDLHQLETLELIDCVINELPHGIVKLKKLRLLDLQGCKIGGNPFEVISRCSRLEELYFIDITILERAFDNENASEFFKTMSFPPTLKKYFILTSYQSISGSISRGLYIEHCSTFALNPTFKDLIRRAEMLDLYNIQDVCKSITPDLVQAIGGGMDELIRLELDSCSNIECLIDTTSTSSRNGTMFSKLVKLKLRDMGHLRELCCGPTPIPCDIFEKLEKLHIDSCEQLYGRLFSRDLNFNRLVVLKIADCAILKSIFTFSTAQSLVLLEKFKICRCEELQYVITDDREEPTGEEIVYHGHDQKSYNSMFPKLRSLDIDGCRRLEFIFPLSCAWDLPLLRIITVGSSSELKYIFGLYQHEDLQLLHQKEKQITLPALEEIQLNQLPNFISIFPETSHQDNSGSCTSNDFLIGSKARLANTTAPTASNLEQLPHSDTSQCLFRPSLAASNIRKMYLRHCPNVTSLFTLSVAITILLEELTIEECHGLRNIIIDDGGDHNHMNSSTFPQLKELYVKGCNLLESIFPATLSGGLVHLNNVRIMKASKLKYVFGVFGQGHQNQNQIHIDLPALEIVELIHLKSLESICIKNCHPTWPSLRDLDLKGCPQLTANSVSDFMVRSDVRESDHPDIKNMQGLEEVRIFDCKMESIFQLEGPAFNGQRVLTLGLKEMRLKNLPQLKHTCICPKQILSLQYLTFLEFDQCEKLKAIFSASILRSLPQLEKLYITKCDQLERIIEDYEEDQLLLSHRSTQHQVLFPNLRSVSIHCCNNLHRLFSISTSRELPKLEYLKVDEAIKLEQVFGRERGQTEDVEEIFALENLESLELIKLPSLVNLCCGFKFQTECKVYVHECPKFITEGTGVLTISDWLLRGQDEALKILKTYKKYSSDGIHVDTLFQLEACLSVQGQPLISSIEEMHLCRGFEMKYIFKGPMQFVSLQNLKFLVVDECQKLKTIFSVCILRSLPQLERLKIAFCRELEQILEDYDDDKVVSNESSQEVCFPKLKIVRVIHCRKLRHLFTACILRNLPQLEHLQIEYCQELEHILEDYVDDKAVSNEISQQVCFPKLKTVEVQSCEKLRYLFTACILRSLSQLERLKITNCEELEQILEDYDDDEVVSNESPQQVCFPKLIKIEVGYCNKLRHLFSISTSLELPQLCYLRIENAPQLKEVFESKGMKEEVFVLPSMEYLELIELPSLTKVCQGFKLQSDYCQMYVRECPKLNSSSSAANPEVTENETKETSPELQPQQTQASKTDQPSFQSNANQILPLKADDQLAQECNQNDSGIDSEELLKLDSKNKTKQEEKFSPTGSPNDTESVKETARESAQNDYKSKKPEMATSSTASELNDIVDAQDMVQPILMDQEEPRGEETKFGIEIPQTTIMPNNDCVEERGKQRAQSLEKAKIESLLIDFGPRKSAVGSSIIPIHKALPQELINRTPIEKPALMDQQGLHGEKGVGTISETPERTNIDHEEVVGFHGLMKIDSRSAPLLHEAIAKYPHLWEWQKCFPPRYCEWGYKSLSDMLMFLKSKTPKAMDESSKEEFDKLYAELESFGFDREWLASIHQRVMVMQIDNEKLKQVAELKSQESALVEQLNNVRFRIDRIRNDLSKYDNVFDF